MTVHRRPIIFCLLFTALAAGTLPTRPADARERGSKPAAANVAPAEEDAAIDEPPQSGPSDAERIARLDRAVHSDEKRLRELKASLNDPSGEYAEAKEEFEKLDEAYLDTKEKLESAPKSVTSEEIRRLRTEFPALEKKWALAKERFDLAIDEHKAVQESIDALEEKIARDREEIEVLRGEGKPDEAPEESAPASEKHEPAERSDEPETKHESTADEPATSNAPPKKKVAKRLTREMALAEASMLEPASSNDEEESAELAMAASVARQTESAASQAERRAQSITQRIEILTKNIDLARQLRKTAHRKVDNADETLKSLNEELFRKMMEGANTDALRRDIQEATERVREARNESREVSEHLDDLQSTVAALQAEQVAAARDADEKRLAAERAAAVVEDLNNPFTVHNLLQWLLDHGPKIMAILVAVMMCLQVSRIAEGRLVSFITNRGSIGNREERENRAKTLLGIFHNAANVVVLGGGAVAVLDEVGIPVTPLIGGAAVVGLAVAFGAQSLIKDYFTGFLVLLEQQYLINDVVKIGEITGQVERITLRTTVLRDLEGRLHFIPHGQISIVSNTTHGWARAVFEIRISYRENVDRAIEVLMSLARELRSQEAYRGMILDDPVMLGVEALTDSGVLIKFHIKTRPLQQWPVERELLRRIKNKFDELQIEIANSQLRIHRNEDAPLGVVEEPRHRQAG